MDIGPDPEAEANGDPGNRRGILLLRRLRSGDGGGGGELAAVLASPTRSRPSASESAIRPGVGGGVVMFGARIQSESARLRCTYSTKQHLAYRSKSILLYGSANLNSFRNRNVHVFVARESPAILKELRDTRMREIIVMRYDYSYADLCMR